MKPHQDNLYTLSEMLAQAQTILTGLVRNKRDDLAQAMDLVTRKEFDTALAMIQKARQKQTEIEKRLKAIEGKMTLSSTQSPQKKKQIRRS
ncbi:MAG: accessory factor UbiK family protein [Alphaproteobacteria bacterium]|nr:accessory factor UbiK family protein [Alphaproteobacteria bacterium]